jgi:hypothetical protein
MAAEPLLARFVRLFLGVAFVFYGLVKILGGQFLHEPFVIDSRTTDGTTLVWSFYGWSDVYGRLIGAGEFLAGALLLVPRTRTLGALVLFPITANITMLDFCFGFPAVKYVSLSFTLGCGYLLLREWPRLRPAILPPAAPTAPGAAAPPQRVRRGARLAVDGLAVLFALLLGHALLAEITPGPDVAARAACVAQGRRVEDLELLRWSASGASGFFREGFVEFGLRGSSPPRLLHVAVKRPHSLVDWSVVSIEERPR